MEALKSMSAPHARVLRSNRRAVIDASDLVPGDIILVKRAISCPRTQLIESASLKSEESALTGESVPVERTRRPPWPRRAAGRPREHALFRLLRDRHRGRAIVTATGMDTEMGRIAGLLSADDTQTPLQHKLARMGKLLGIVALAACAVIFVVGLTISRIGDLRPPASRWRSPAIPGACPPSSQWCFPSAYSAWRRKRHHPPPPAVMMPAPRWAYTSPPARLKRCFQRRNWSKPRGRSRTPAAA